MNLPEYPFHEIAEIFPLMEGADFKELKRDIEQNGQQEPIWIYQGRIIDGRNRYRACHELGRPVLTREWDGNGSLVAFVQSLNLRRRHLDESQRGMVALRIKHRFEAEARERMLAGKRAEPSKTPEKSDPVADLPQGLRSGEKAREAAARQMGVSPRLVQDAERIQRNGTPNLVKAVECGEVAVSAAVEVARLSKPEQEKIVSQGAAAIVRHAAEARAQRVEVKRRKGQSVISEDSQDDAADLGVKWVKVIKELRFWVKSLTDDQVKSVARILLPVDRKDNLTDLRECAQSMSKWIKILESNHAGKIRTLN